MITRNNIDRLDKIVAHYAMQDFKRANPQPKRYANGKTNYKPYSLSPLTNEARKMLHLARKEMITPEEEREVKAYLLKHKMLFDM